MLEWVISSCVLILAAVFVRAVFGEKIGFRFRYALWALVLLRLLMPFTPFESNVSVMNTVNQSGIYQSVNDAFDNKDVALPDEDNHKFSAGDIIKGVWLTGSIITAAWLVCCNTVFYNRLRRSRKKITNSGKLPVYVADVETPCLFGVLFPAIYVPSDCVEDEQILSHAIQHERVHARHLDNVWSQLRALCIAVHWFNPLVWLAAFMSGEDAELACDEEVTMNMNDIERAAYGRTLLKTTVNHRPDVFTTATTMASSKRGIKQRITRIAQKPRRTVIALIMTVLIMVLAVSCTFAGAKSTNRYNEYIPQEYISKLEIFEGEGKAIFAIYEKESRDNLKVAGLEDESIGWLLSVIRVTKSDYKEMIEGDNSGQEFFGRDGEYYYAVICPTDSTEFASSEWSTLYEILPGEVIKSFTEKNNLSAIE